MGRPAITPEIWEPPAAPPRARRNTSTPPMPSPYRFNLAGNGPEDVVIDESGRIITGTADGRLIRLRPHEEGTAEAGADTEVIADTGGRPLGIELADDGRLIVCDAQRGLLRVNPDDGQVETLVERDTTAERLRLCNNAAMATDGSVYFTDSSRRFGLEDYVADLLEHSGTGRLLRRNPNGTVDVLLDGLFFANGVALAADESFVAVAETGAYRISRVWLTGPLAGRHDTLIDDLPGIPDNLSTGTDGRIWVALPTARNPLLDWALSRNPFYRKAIWAMPETLRPMGKRTAWVLAVDAAGHIVSDLQTTGEQYHMVTGVREHAGKLYLGSLTEAAVAMVDL